MTFGLKLLALLSSVAALAAAGSDDLEGKMINERAAAQSKVLGFYEKLLYVNHQVETKPHLTETWKEHAANGKEDVAPPPVFNCNVTELRSTKKPMSVHELRPQDIDVIAAFGDSITAGNGLGAETIGQVAIENRGESFSIGGDDSLEEGVVTLPNILRKFNPDLKGASTCASTEDHVYRSWFNVARPGATNDDMLSEAEMLVERMRADTKVNYEEDWKLLTFFVGGNDLCRSCEGKNSAEDYYDFFNRTLTYLSDEMPRTLVNLVSMFDVSPLQNFSTSYACDLLQWGFCSCARNWSTIPALRPLQLAYHDQFVRLANDPRFNDRDDFAVVVQPHMRDLVPTKDENGNYLLGFLSPDCFHPARVTHQGFAVWLWNTMLIPVNQKPYSVIPNEANVTINCPLPDYPYIFTNGNSDVEWPPPTISDAPSSN